MRDLPRSEAPGIVRFMVRYFRSLMRARFPVALEVRSQRGRRLPLLVIAITIAAAAVVEAQQFYRGEGAAYPLKPGMPDAGVQGGFTFCRLWYDPVRREPSGVGWSTDYPRGDMNFVTRLTQLTNTAVTRWHDGESGYAALRATDKAIFQCPFLFAVDAGTIDLNREEVESLRTYLLKGGFLWLDDFWGDRAWASWMEQLHRILPDAQVVELPPDHRLFNTFYVVPKIPQIPSMQYWNRSGGDTAEFGSENRQSMNAVFDDHGRIMVLMTHNTDIGDGWERETDSNVYFHLFSPPAYGIAMNVAMWVLTH
jgi:hypothetical protein